MSKLDELIKELCPNGCEYKTIQSVVGVNRGRRLTKSQLSDDAEYEVYHGSKDSILGKYGQYNAPANTTIVVNTGGIGGVKFIDKPFWCSDGSFWLGKSNEIMPKFLYYALSGYEDYFYSQKRVGGVPTIDKSVVENFQIPLPPMAVQEEIVRILDNFTALTAELTAELTARKKQYEYYRDELLTFGNVQCGTALRECGTALRECGMWNVECGMSGRSAPNCNNVTWKPLGEVAKIVRGGNFQKKDFVENGKPCIHYGQMYTHFGVHADKTLTFVNEEVFAKSKIAKTGDIIMAVTSENVEDVCSCTAWLGDEDIAVSGHTAIISHNQNAKYLSYFFHSSAFFNQKTKLAHGTKVIEVTPNKLENIIVPLPSLEEQERIVSILDRFDSLCNDISEGLPAEIEARQKQYEYYRDALLNYAAKGVAEFN